ncbi:hypothetical protein [Vibrio harveyi]|uniref:hypothetical protein n=1 Tax=Vibrio harveyi TaxID=669 RepID=UPI002380A961|nr:hypothetical protein [Vibrio harveyi]WDZ71740.1 hypothetical protein PWW31_11285 [Vibrio harveyi]
MDVKELYDLALWFDENIVDEDLIESLSEAIVGLQSNGAASLSVKNRYVAELQTPFYEVPVQQLTKNQTQVLRELDVWALFGANAVEYFQHAFADDFSYREIVNILGAGRSALTVARKHLENVAQLLPLVVDVQTELTPIPLGCASIRLTFREDASISNFVDFNSWAKKWFTIGRGFSLATNQKTQDLKIIGAGNGSIFIDVLGNLETLNMIGEATNHLLDIGLKVAEAYGLYKGVKELKERLPKESQATAEHMVDVAKKEFEDKKLTLYTEAAEKMLDAQGGDREHVAALAKALRELDTYIKLGGNIAYLSISTNEDEDEEAMARMCVNQKKLEHTVKQLQSNKSLVLLEDKHDNEEL